MARYALPELRYDYAALEPHVSGKLLELHHQKHHAAYVKNANETIEKLEENREKNDFTRLGALEKALAFNLSGHVLHSIFWQNLAPKAGGQPDGELASAIKQDFGSFESFKSLLTETASTIMGSGWGVLMWEPVAQRLVTCQVYDHQSNLNQGGMPLMVIDAWEHAYYLQYQNQKAAFFKAVWQLWNWKDIAARHASAKRLDLALTSAA